MLSNKTMDALAGVALMTIFALSPDLSGCSSGQVNEDAVCGNDRVEFGETCDGDCPSDCDDGDPCTLDILTGSADDCNAVCSHQAIVTCENGDGCCPVGCQAANDDDCVQACPYEIALDSPAVFLSTFEDGTVDADLRADSSAPLIDARDGGAMEAIPNPHPDACNPSAYVLRASSPPGYTRAEYQSSRLPILDKTYIYTWREYIPADFFDGISLDWMLRAQWKTWPCGANQPVDVLEQLCGGGGIFNDFSIDAHLGSFNFRTRPDCARVQLPTRDHLGTWSTYVLEIRWTQSDSGHYRLYRNGALLAQATDVKTLFDGFQAGDCDMIFATGLYDSWQDQGKDEVEAYFDDIAIFDVDDGVALADVCPTCAAQAGVDTTARCDFGSFLQIVDDELLISACEDGCDWNVGTFDTQEKVEGSASLLWDHGFDGWLQYTAPNYETVMDMSHGDFLSLHVHNNLEEPGNRAVMLFYSQNEATEGDDYYYLLLDFDTTGWRHLLVPRGDIFSSRTPRGWDQIDSLMIRTSGWDCTRNTDRVLRIDEVKFTNDPNG